MCLEDGDDGIVLFSSYIYTRWMFYVNLFIYRLCELPVSDGIMFWLLLLVQEMLL